MAKITQEQFLLATFGISITESNDMVDFEREAYVDLAIKEKKMQLEMMGAMAGVSHLSSL